MSILKLVQYPDPLLKMVSTNVETIDDNLQKFMDDMLETMYHSQGLGLAAVQVGLLKRIFVIDVDQMVGTPKPYFFINPEIIEVSEEKKRDKEGCLSFPGGSAQVERAYRLKVKFLDYHGVEQLMELEDLFARAFQHELDHLNGVVYVDHVSPIKRSLIQAKAQRLAT